MGCSRRQTNEQLAANGILPVIQDRCAKSRPAPHRVVVMLIGVGLFCALLDSPVHASGSGAEGAGSLSVGAGTQYAAWSVSGRKIRLSVLANSGMAASKCMDSMVDWYTNGTGHYDARVVRSCLPGGYIETDPGGDGYWNEFNTDWITRVINKIQRGYGYTIDDTNLAVLNFDHYNFGNLAGLQAAAPGTGTQGYARVRTLYQNGSIKSCNPLPAYASDGSGGSGGCS